MIQDKTLRAHRAHLHVLIPEFLIEIPWLPFRNPHSSFSEQLLFANRGLGGTVVGSRHFSAVHHSSSSGVMPGSGMRSLH